MDGEQLLQVAERYYEQLEYEEALKILIQVHQVPNVTPMQRARAFLYMGVCFTALGNAENATLSFMELLKVKPNFRLPPGISPSIQQMFKEALHRMKLPETAPPTPPEGQGGPDAPTDIPVSLDVKVPGSVAAGQAIEVAIRVDDPRKLVHKLQIRWRRVGGPDFSSIKVPYSVGTKRVTARIPGATVGDSEGKLQLMVEAMGRGGMTLAHEGSMDAPRVVTLTASKKPGRKWGWWAVGIGGGLAVVGGIVAVVLLTRDSGGGGNGNLADVTIVIH